MRELHGERDYEQYNIEFEDKEIKTTHENTAVYLHTLPIQKMFDHIYVIIEGTPMQEQDEPIVEEMIGARRIGWFLFRHILPEDTFDEMCETLVEEGYTLVRKPWVTRSDQDAYFQSANQELDQLDKGMPEDWV